jgi:hypothetical protein
MLDLNCHTYLPHQHLLVRFNDRTKFEDGKFYGDYYSLEFFKRTKNKIFVKKKFKIILRTINIFNPIFF